jgi:S-adenosylmethionine:tRNA ribosyltransferase-isomerase
LTNFHQPESTLLMLIAALVGFEEVLKAYKWAVEREFRFYSYGDSSLLWLK